MGWDRQGMWVLAGERCLAGEGGKGWRRGFPTSEEEASSAGERGGDGGRGACEGGEPLRQGLLPFGGAFGEEGVSLPVEEGPALERAGGLRRSLGRDGEMGWPGVRDSERGVWGGST